MQIGLVGLGRMGSNMSRRWLGAGHSVVGYARHAETVDGLLDDRAISAGATSVMDLVGQLAPPMVVWLMVLPASVDRRPRETWPPHGGVALGGPSSRSTPRCGFPGAEGGGDATCGATSGIRFP